MGLSCDRVDGYDNVGGNYIIILLKNGHLGYETWELDVFGWVINVSHQRMTYYTLNVIEFCICPLMWTGLHVTS